MISLESHLSQLRTRKKEGKTQIFCLIRKKWLIITPEEVVRQAAILHLVKIGYSPNLISVEKGITVHKMNRRYDIVVFKRNGEALILVECKQPGQALVQDAADQASLYNTYLGGKYIWITNGYDHRIFEINHLKKSVGPVHSLPLPHSSPD